MVLAFVVSVALCGAPKVDPKLVGTWLAGNEPFMTLAGNGTGTMEEGKLKWSADGSNLTITDDTGETDRATYQVEGDSMTMTLGGFPVQLRRAGAGVAVKKQSALQAKAAKAAQVSEEDADKEAMAQAQAWLAQNGQGGQQPRQQPPQGAQRQGQPRAAGADQLSQLLTSSAWCSFSYNKVSGTTNTSRVVYRRDGTWAAGAQTETYNSGPNGSVAGQYGNNNGGLWEVRNNQLYGSYGNAPVELVQPFSVTLNSSGAPIINALGKEYMRCN